jgi:hypothetical protein
MKRSGKIQKIGSYAVYSKAGFGNVSFTDSGHMNTVTLDFIGWILDSMLFCVRIQHMNCKRKYRGTQSQSFALCKSLYLLVLERLNLY